MARSSYYANNLNRNLNDSEGLPVISQDLDAVRTYQWEITFFPPAEVDGVGPFSKPLTLAAKQVNGMSVEVETIEVNRINDKVHYPGKPSYGDLEVTFDNLLKTKTGTQLYKYMQSVWDVTTGEYTSSFLDAPGLFKSTIEVIELNGQNEPVSVVKLVGAYPTSWKKAEKNYNQSEFDSVSVTFKYDFIIQSSDTAN